MSRFKPGHTKVGGRKVGTPNKVSPERVSVEVAKLLDGVFPDITPLEAIMLCLRWSLANRDRLGILAAAQAAAPFVHPRLSAGTMQVRHEYADRDDQALLIEAEALESRISAMRKRLAN